MTMIPIYFQMLVQLVTCICLVTSCCGKSFQQFVNSKVIEFLRNLFCIFKKKFVRKERFFRTVTRFSG